MLSNLLCIRYEMVFPSLLENINLHSNAFKMSQWSRAQISSDMKPGTVRGSISLYQDLLPSTLGAGSYRVGTEIQTL